MLNTSYSLTSQIKNQQALENQISDLNYDISSTVKVHVASDDPAAAARMPVDIACEPFCGKRGMRSRHPDDAISEDRSRTR